MDLKSAVTTNLRSYAEFSGKAGRSEFWWFFLFCLFLNLISAAFDGLIAGNDRDKPILQFLVGIALYLPYSAVGWRRIADVGLPGWINFLPMIFTMFFYLYQLSVLTGSEAMSQEEYEGLSLLFLLVMLPYLIIWCLPSKRDGSN